jgi:hypothetical protein
VSAKDNPDPVLEAIHKCLDRIERRMDAIEALLEREKEREKDA